VTAAGASARRTAPGFRGQFRYGVVFLLVLLLLVFEIIAPDGDGTRAADVALAALALMVTVATSRAPGGERRLRALAVSAAGLVVVIGTATGLFPAGVAYAVLAVVAVSIPAALFGGLSRLIRSSGVTVQVVAGALAIYLLVGLLFASLIGFIAHVSSTPYFKEGNTSNGIHVYYSFTVLTTTGFGDYTPAAPVGHALAVLEMLTGQLYLVTVIGILIGNFAGRRMTRDGGG